VSAVAIAVSGVGDHGGGIGGALDLRQELGRTLSLRVGAGARFGVDPPSAVTTRFFSAAVGVGWTAWASRNGRGAVGLRVDALAVLGQFEHRAPDTDTVTKYKLMPGADLLAEARYFFARGIALVAGAGGESVFGETAVFVSGQRTTTLGPVRPVVELGLRAGF
jgi:hypothetical protein